MVPQTPPRKAIGSPRLTKSKAQKVQEAIRSSSNMSFQNQKFDQKKYVQMLHSYGKKSPAKTIAMNNDLPEVENLDVELELLEDIDDCNLGDDLEQ